MLNLIQVDIAYQFPKAPKNSRRPTLMQMVTAPIILVRLDPKGSTLWERKWIDAMNDLFHGQLSPIKSPSFVDLLNVRVVPYVWETDVQIYFCLGFF